MSAEPVMLHHAALDNASDDVSTVVRRIHRSAKYPGYKACALNSLLQPPNEVCSSEVLSGLLAIASDLDQVDVTREAALKAFARGVRKGNVLESHAITLVQIVREDMQSNPARLCALEEALPKVLDANPEAITDRQIGVLRLIGMEPAPVKLGLWETILKGFGIKPQSVIERRYGPPKPEKGEENRPGADKRKVINDLCDRITGIQPNSANALVPH